MVHAMAEGNAHSGTVAQVDSPSSSAQCRNISASIAGLVAPIAAKSDLSSRCCANRRFSVNFFRVASAVPFCHLLYA